MAILGDYALTPDVFDEREYAHPELCRAWLEGIKDVLLHDGLVRDLRNGDWAQLLASGKRQWHFRGRELVTKLAQQGRLIKYAPFLISAPNNDVEWCEEALGTHNAVTPLTGIFVTSGVASAFPKESKVASIDRLGSAPWWTDRSASMRVQRTLEGYLKALNLILRHAKSIMFIDPHIDPVNDHYRHFSMLLAGAGTRSPRPRIEIHRKLGFRTSGQHRTMNDPKSIEDDFRSKMTEPLNRADLNVEVFIWDDFHDRYVISDLVGISVPHGFGTTTCPTARTTWTRMGRKDREDVQREFDRNVRPNKIKHSFTVPRISRSF
jgi:hypothetical protein